MLDTLFTSVGFSNPDSPLEVSQTRPYSLEFKLRRYFCCVPNYAYSRFTDPRRFSQLHLNTRSRPQRDFYTRRSSYLRLLCKLDVNVLHSLAKAGRVSSGQRDEILCILNCSYCGERGCCPRMIDCNLLGVEVCESVMNWKILDTRVELRQSSVLGMEVVVRRGLFQVPHHSSSLRQSAVDILESSIDVRKFPGKGEDLRHNLALGTEVVVCKSILHLLTPPSASH